jgi:exosortase
MKDCSLIRYTLPSAIISVFLLSMLPALQKLTMRWDNSDSSYCYLIVPLFLYLCWEKRGAFRFGEFSWNLWGMVPVGSSILMIIIGELGATETLLYLGIWGCVAGLMVVLYSQQLRQLCFPVLILAFIVPMPAYINRLLTFKLRLVASGLSVSMLRLAGLSVLLNGNVIDLGLTQLQVVDACSGLRYFVPLIILALLFGYFSCRRKWQKALILIAVPPLSIVVNGFRIFLTGMLHLWGYSRLAENHFHDLTGLVIFLLAAGILFGISSLLRGIESSKLKTERIELKAESSKFKNGNKIRAQGSMLKFNNSRAYQLNSYIDTPNDQKGPNTLRKPAAITVVLCLLFVATGYALRRFPSENHLPERASFDSFPSTIGKWQAKRDYLPQKILKNLWSDDYLSATYFAKGKSNAIHLLIPFYKYQNTLHTAHAPQSCMLGTGWALMSSRKRYVATSDGHRFPIMTDVWEKDGSK